MKKSLIILLVLLTALVLTTMVAQAGPPAEKKATACATIQNGMLTYSAGHYLADKPLTVGYDAYGYNYQAHMFSGSYANAYLGRDGFPPYDGDTDGYLAANPGADSKWYWPYRDNELVMKWNDAWLSNVDCDGDGLLDRHSPSSSYIGSGAWETNHQKGSYDMDGRSCKWEYFVKIVAAPADATQSGGFWYASNETEIGSVIWNEFATIQEVYNDPCAGDHGLQYVSPDHAGFGGW
jgi:hypothetical protein